MEDKQLAPRVLILTPVKDATPYLARYFEALSRLTYPQERLSLGLLESDSNDGTYDAIEARLPALRASYARVGLWKRDFGFVMPPNVARWAAPFQIPRRIVLARSRNHLLFRALDDEDWVLWLDVDVEEYPPDVIERLMAAGKEIVQPHCLRRHGSATFDHNAWRDRGRLLMRDLREEGELVRLDAVGGTMLLIKADVHRDGLIFPPLLYGRASRVVRQPNPWKQVGEIETEGLGVMAQDMGLQCWGMPHLEIRHAQD